MEFRSLLSLTLPGVRRFHEQWSGARVDMIQVRTGNLFESRAATLVNPVNCVGVMGKGLALEFKRRFPAMFRDYKARCNAGLVRPGEPYLYRDLTGTSVLNFPTKDHWKFPSRFEDIERGLDALVDRTELWGLTTVAMPALGCGNGGLQWVDVGPAIYCRLHTAPIAVELFAPLRTPSSELTLEFLGAPSHTR